MPRPIPSQTRIHRTGPLRVRSTVFRSGNGQAVRIPVSLRLDCDEVAIRREGATLVIEPVGATGWPVGYFDGIEAGSTLERAPQPKVPPIRRWDDPR